MRNQIKLFSFFLLFGCFYFDANAQVNKFFNSNNYTPLDNISKFPDGSSIARAASSAKAIKDAYPNVTDGVYYINLPTIGVKPVYCLMNSKYDGGGWMMAMKTTRGTNPTFNSTTFNFDANYWYTANTLNPDDVTRNDADAKFDVMNYYPAQDIMALWPDIPNSSTESGSIDNLNNWSWLQNSFNGGTRTTLINFFTQTPTATTYQTKTGTNSNVGINFSGFSNTVFSTEWGFMFYGLNYTANTGHKVRWGFSFNNEQDQISNDASSGIGLSNSYSSGDVYTFCCAGVTQGINRSARVEMYIR